MELVFVKAGGSWITFKDKPFTVDYRALEALAYILKRSMGIVRIILGHGGGSFAHPVVEATRRGDRVKSFILCHKATRLLNSIVYTYLLENGHNVVSMQTSAFIYCRDECYALHTPIELLLDHGIVPIVYGDCVPCNKDVYRVVSTEEIFRLLTPLLKPSRIVYLERVGGIYTRDPMRYSDAELIPRIDRSNYGDILKVLGGAHGIDVTGGMRSKVEYMIELARSYGVESIVVSGFSVEDAVKAIVYGEGFKGTIITW